MPIIDQNRIYDGWVSLEGGVDAGRAPVLVDPNMAVSTENMVFRGGRPKPRPGFRRMTEDFRNPNLSYYSNGLFANTAVSPPPPPPDVVVPGQDSMTNYKQGIMQCVIGYQPHNGEECLMAMIGGRLYKIIPLINSCQVTEIGPIVDKNSPYSLVQQGGGSMAPTSSAQDPNIFNVPYRNNKNLPIAYMVQADKWLVIQDGEARPILYDGSTCRRADSGNTDPNKTEVPVGTIMAYGNGRLCVVVNDRDVAFGDLYGSHALADPGDSLILFTERNFLAEGFDAAIPFTMGIATGMSFFPQLDTSTGVGPLLVFAERGASSFDLTQDRSTWGSSGGFQTTALITTGLRGHRSISVAGEDLWFRAEDGYRNYRQARSEPIGWAHIPQSTNVRQFLDNDEGTLLKFASSVYFDNRVVGTCSPVWNNGRPFHEGLVILDFDILSSFGTKFRPAWDGHWTLGQLKVSNLPVIKISQIVTAQFAGVTRCFVFGLDTTKDIPENQLYELTMTDVNDWDNQRVDWELVSRAFDFKQQNNNPFTENTLYDGDIWLSEIRETDVGELPVPPPEGT